MAQSRQVLKVGFHSPPKVSPVLNWNEDRELVGYMPELLRSMARQMDVELEFLEFPGTTEVTTLLDSGTVDIWALIRIHEGDDPPVLTGPAVMVSLGAIVRRPDTPPLERVADLRTFRILAQENGATSIWLTDQEIPHATETTFGQVLDAVASGRYEYAPSAYIAASSWINHRNLASKLVVDRFPEEALVRMFTWCVAKGNQPLHDRLKTAFSTVRADGTASELYLRHIAPHQDEARLSTFSRSPGANAISSRAALPVIRVGIQPSILPDEVAAESSDGKASGYLVDLMNEVGRLYGSRVEFVFGEAGDLHYRLTEGELDVLGVDLYSTQPSPLSERTRPYLTLKGMIYMAEGALVPRRLSDLQLCHLAVSAGSLSHQYLKSVNAMNLTTTSSVEDAFRLLEEGRVDGVVTADLSGHLVAKSIRKRTQACELPARGFEIGCSLGVQSGNTPLLWDLDDALTLLRNNGTEQKIYDRWLAPILPRPAPPLLSRQEFQVAVGLSAVALLAALAWIWSVRRELARRTAEVREAEARYRHLFHSTTDGHVILRDFDAHPIEANAAANRLLNLADRKLNSFEWLAPLVAAANASGSSSIHGVPLGPDASTYIDATCSSLARKSVMFLVVRDVTDRVVAERRQREFETRLQRAKQMESIGQLASGVAHDFNNILVAIMGNGLLAVQELPPSHPGRAHLDTVLLAAQKGADITRQMLAFSGKSSGFKRPANLGEIVRDIFRVMEVTVGEKTRMHLTIAPSLPLVNLDQAQLSQFVMNLISNASDSIPATGGTIDVRVYESFIEPGAGCELGPCPVSGRCVCLEVKDTGVGMTKSVQERMFEPFFSTKSSGRGLGLSAAMGIVRSHGGALQVESAPQRGTRILACFPLRHQDAPVFTLEAKPLPPGAGRLRVLVVDNEPLVRQVTHAFLAQDLFDVESVSSGSEAVTLCCEHPFDVVVLDLMMPGMCGEETIAQLRRLIPSQAIVLTSGNLKDMRSHAVPSDVVLLQKPFDASALRSAVESAYASTYLAHPAPGPAAI